MMAIPALVLGGLLIGPMHLEVNGGAIDEADAADLSRMAWLCLHADDRAKAWDFTKLGLQHDRENEYCKRLEDKLSP